jgi:hypothetical protein
MNDDAITPADRIERALRDHEERKKAAAELAAQHAPDAERLKALQAQIDALPPHERRAVLNAAGMHNVSAAPKPITPIRGGGFIATPSPQSVRWAVWRALPHAQLWQAVALSLNLEPIQTMLDHVRRAPSRHFRPGLPAEYFDRLAVCQRALSTTGPIKPQGPLYSGMLKNPQCDVLVSEVAAFLVRAEFTVPAEMRELPPPIADADPAEAKPVAATVTRQTLPGEVRLPPLTTPDIADAFDGIGGQTAQQWRAKLGDVNNHQWLIGARALAAKAPKPATWWPIAFAELLLAREASAESLKRAFLTQPKLKPWLPIWQEKHRERNAFGQ